jgi:ribosomal-protein-alanine N-acetyltransferase
MLETDAAAVAILENQVSLDPWPEKLFGDCIRVGYSCWVFEDNSEIAGFGLLSCAAGEAHILNLVIDNRWRRQGLGKRMMHHLINTARELGADIVYLEVRESNLIARDLYRTLAFTEIGVRKGYYPAKEGREDAITLALGLV